MKIDYVGTSCAQHSPSHLPGILILTALRHHLTAVGAFLNFLRVLYIIST